MKRFACFLPVIGISWFLILGCTSTSTEPDTTPPAVPTGFSVDFNHTTDGEIALTWNANTESDLAGYKLYRQDGVGADFNEIGTTNQTSYVQTGLDYNTEYDYKIQAYDKSDNYSDFASLSGAVAPINQLPPAKPTGLSIYAHNQTGLLDIELKWTPNSESDFAYYKVYRATAGVFPADSAHMVDSLTTTSFTDTMLTVGTRYYYKILAYDKEPLPSNPSDVVTDVPLPAPTLIGPANSSTASSARPTFSWNRLTDAVGYQITVMESAQSGTVWETKLDQPDSGDPSIAYPATATALVTGGTYYWFVGTYSITDQSEVNSYSATYHFLVP